MALDILQIIGFIHKTIYSM